MQLINTIKKYYLKLILLIFLILINLTKEDLPVHCLKHEVNKTKKKFII